MTAPARGHHDFEAVKANYPLLEEVQRHVKMKKAGQEWAGLCPFHGERSPSFLVNPQKEKFKCHGCGAAGDVVDFVRMLRGCTPAEAIEEITGGKVAILGDGARHERERLREDRDMEEAQRKERGTRDAQRRWDAASAFAGTHAYLAAKGITDLVEELALARIEAAGSLLIAMDGPDGELQTVQAISPTGEKKFHTGAPSKLARKYIGISFGGATIVCEGFATGCSIYQARADRVCVTFSAGNMEAVARQLHSEDVPIVLAPDKDQLAHFEEIGRELGCPVISPAVPGAKADFNDQHQELGLDSVRATITDGLRDYAARIEREKRDLERENEPLDLWTRTPVPGFPEAMLPPLIARFAKVRADMVGCDPSGMAMAAIAACGAVIKDSIRLKMKRHDDWKESARLWVMLVGDPSRKKSPILSGATRRVAQLDKEMIVTYNRALRDWNEDKEGEPPTPHRLRIEDITPESAAEVCAANPEGVLSLQDELSGWFGGIEKYSGGKGGAKDRAFWLQAYNGGHYAADRIGRKASFVENLSISMVGGVQPDPIRRIMQGATDDGLIQRFLPIMLADPTLGKDVEMPDVAFEYDGLIDRLHQMRPPETFLGYQCLTFDDEAQALRNDLEAKHLAMMVAFEGVNRKIASHFGKYDGMFGRLCVIFHAIECATEAPGGPLRPVVGVTTAKRAADFLHRFLRRHALAFYTNVAGLSDDHDIMTDVAGYILAHNLERVSLRTLGRGTRRMRKLTNFEGHAIFEQMVAHGWLEEDSKRSDARAWGVNPLVHTLYADRAAQERVKSEAARKIVRDALDGV